MQARTCSSTLAHAPGRSLRRPGASLPTRYQPLKLVDTHDAAEVWQARDRTSGQLLALKLLMPGAQAACDARRALRSEAWIASRVQSPRLVRVVEAQVDAEPAFIAREWIAAPLLSQCPSTGPFPVRSALWIVRQVAEGLRAIAEAECVPAEVDPRHIFLLRTGEIRMLCRGHARKLPADRGTGPGRLAIAGASTSTHVASGPLHGVRMSLGRLLLHMLADGAAGLPADTARSDAVRAAISPHGAAISPALQLALDLCDASGPAGVNSWPALTARLLELEVAELRADLRARG